jgi:hypothetical protein
MAITNIKFEPDKIINNVEYYRVGTVAMIIGKSRQTLQLWDTWSTELEEEGKDRLIPACTRIGKNNIRCWTADEIQLIIDFANSIEYGCMAEFSRRQWGERKNHLQQDRSIAGRKARQQYRNQINKNGKKLERQRKVSEIKNAREDMLRTVRSRAKSLYGQINYK